MSLRVVVRGGGVPSVVLGTGETLLVGRAPVVPDGDPDAALRVTALALPRSAAHVSRVVGEVVVGEEMVRLRWRGSTEAQLSSLFDAPGGARRVALTDGMSAFLDEGENHVLLLRGRQADEGLTDLVLVVLVEEVREDPAADSGTLSAASVPNADAAATAPAPRLEELGREWFVALALAEPWLTGSDDYPRPPSNREIYERVRAWHGYAWNLDKAQRVDDAIRVVARMAFGPQDDPFTSTAGRVQNVRFAVGRRAAEVRLVTAEDLGRVQARAAARPPRDP